MPDRRSAEDRVRQIAYGNGGFVTVEAARRAAIPTATLRTLAARGQLMHVSHGVYALPSVLRWSVGVIRAALLWPCCPGAVVGHAAAAWLWTEVWWRYAFSGPVTVLVPRRYRSNRPVPPSLVLVRGDLPRRSVTRFWGMPVQTPRAALSAWIEAADPRDGAVGEELDYRLTLMRDRRRITPDEERGFRRRLAALGWPTEVYRGDD